MMDNFASFTCRYGVSNVLKITEVVAFSINFYGRQPFLHMRRPGNTKMPGGALSYFAPVLLILRARNIAQVTDAVVRFYVVDVVYLIRGPFAVNVKPRQPVRLIATAIHTYSYVSVLQKAFAYVSGLMAPPHIYAPPKNSCFGIVVQ